MFDLSNHKQGQQIHDYLIQETNTSHIILSNCPVAFKVGQGYKTGMNAKANAGFLVKFQRLIMPGPPFLPCANENQSTVSCHGCGGTTAETGEWEGQRSMLGV